MKNERLGAIKRFLVVSIVWGLNVPALGFNLIFVIMVLSRCFQKDFPADVADMYSSMLLLLHVVCAICAWSVLAKLSFIWVRKNLLSKRLAKLGLFFGFIALGSLGLFALFAFLALPAFLFLGWGFCSAE